jgi:hypothetical protein
MDAVDAACTVLSASRLLADCLVDRTVGMKRYATMSAPSTNAVRAVAELEREHGSAAELEATVRLPAGAELTVDGVELAGWTGGCVAVLHPRDPRVVVSAAVLAVHQRTGATFRLAELAYPEDGVVVFGTVGELLEHSLPPAA